MGDPTSDFFAGLQQSSAQRLGNVTGSIRIDLDIDLERATATEHWLLVINKGQISVSNKNAKADATLLSSKETFNRLVRGEANPFASVLRGLIEAEGDTELIVLFQGLFPASRNPLSGQAEAAKEAALA